VLKSFLFKVKDHRRKQGRRYELGHILLFTILAILSGADSYRKVQKFIVTHYLAPFLVTGRLPGID
jgi:hypothetical protein